MNVKYYNIIFRQIVHSYCNSDIIFIYLDSIFDFSTSTHHANCAFSFKFISFQVCLTNAASLRGQLIVTKRT